MLQKHAMIEKKNLTCNIREKTTIAKIVLNELININYNKTKKIANYDNRNYAFCREVLEIASNSKTCNTIDYFSIDKE